VFARIDDDKKAWRFALLRGSNAGFTAKQVKDSLTIEGVKELQKVFSNLAEGEGIGLIGNLPPEIRKELEDYCVKEKLRFHYIGASWPGVEEGWDK